MIGQDTDTQIIKDENDLVTYFAPKIKQYAISFGLRLGMSPDDMEQDIYILLIKSYRWFISKHSNDGYNKEFDLYFSRSIKNFFINIINSRTAQSRQHTTMSLDAVVDTEDNNEFNISELVPSIDLDLTAQVITGMTIDQIIALPKKEFKKLAESLRGDRRQVSEELKLQIVNEYINGSTITELFKKHACKGLKSSRKVRNWTDEFILKGIITKEQLEERMTEKSGRTRHTADHKREIVMEYLDAPVNVTAKEIAAKHSINQAQIWQWKKQLEITQEKNQTAVARSMQTPPSETK